jgi:hypothetical protein
MIIREQANLLDKTPMPTYGVFMNSALSTVINTDLSKIPQFSYGPWFK